MKNIEQANRNTVESFGFYKNQVQDTIDVMDVNAGDHGKKFATNFDPETNMLEIQGDSFYWEDNAWKQVPCHSRMLEFDFPLVGKHKVYSMAHDEVRSMKEFIPAKRNFDLPCSPCS